MQMRVTVECAVVQAYVQDRPVLDSFFADPVKSAKKELPVRLRKAPAENTAGVVRTIYSRRFERAGHLFNSTESSLESAHFSSLTTFIARKMAPYSGLKESLRSH
jgi:hypothetical protein